MTQVRRRWVTGYAARVARTTFWVSYVPAPFSSSASRLRTSARAVVVTPWAAPRKQYRVAGVVWFPLCGAPVSRGPLASGDAKALPYCAALAMEDLIVPHLRRIATSSNISLHGRSSEQRRVTAAAQCYLELSASPPTPH
ncbi:hypothetical protein K466DRAFT_405733 [Polyporus arcularius HHB13444]|uniref:Uncharacterized protein n=1 Tax=Polyporus arcularius HHB13444 TaxID=1314778 RepID=A0A5C3PP71_9APHY|nr:hypothetical protein K466DRAFT_405733 [Polyporus arcularius HHB13444]